MNIVKGTLQETRKHQHRYSYVSNKWMKEESYKFEKRFFTESIKNHISIKMNLEKIIVQMIDYNLMYVVI